MHWRYLILSVPLIALFACSSSSSGNRDTAAPLITLIGANPQIIEAGMAYVELGATASDNRDGDLSTAIRIDSSDVDTMVAGDYSVTYDVTDAAGNAAATVTRTVRVENPPPPAAPQVTVEGAIKQLVFSWDDVVDADYYRLLENPDGHSGFTQVGDDIPAGTTSYAHDVAVHLQDWLNGLYLVEACNLGGCTGSAQMTARDHVLESIGYFKASNPGSLDNFGMSVALSGDGRVLAVGAPSEDSGSTGIGGNQSDNSEELSGAVYVFRKSGGVWSQEAYVKASNAEEPDSFGNAVALSYDGDTLVVGARYEHGGDGHINGNEASNGKGLAGAAYVFRYDGAAWSQEAYIKASNSGIGDLFGTAVSLSADGNTLAVGAPDEGSSATGINGEPYDNGAPYSGAAYLFRFENTSWVQQAYVKASNTGESDKFGTSVALSADGDTLAVGAQGEGSNATGVNGVETDDSMLWAGAVYVFRFSNDSWSQQAYVKASNTEALDGFGERIALSAGGDTLVAISRAEDSNATGIDGNQNDNSADWAGAAYVFRYDGDEWSQEAYIKASNTSVEDFFGVGLSLSGDGNVLAVGAYGESSSATGVNGDQNDSSATLSGATYVFRFDGAEWAHMSYVKAAVRSRNDSSLATLERFGLSVALSADGMTLAVGAPGEDGGSTGVGGDALDDSVSGAGAVWVY